MRHLGRCRARYSYDSASQLAAITYQLGSTRLGDLAYGYDNAGRRTTVTGSFARTGLPNAVATTAYNAANQLTQWGTATLTYDPNGNMLSSGTDGYTWDARNRLVSTLSGASFQYDPFGRRVGSQRLKVKSQKAGGASAVPTIRGYFLEAIAQPSVRRS